MAAWTEIWTETDRYVFEDGTVYKSNKDAVGHSMSIPIGRARTVQDAIAVVKSHTGQRIESVETKSD